MKPHLPLTLLRRLLIPFTAKRLFTTVRSASLLLTGVTLCACDRADQGDSPAGNATPGLSAIAAMQGLGDISDSTIRMHEEVRLSDFFDWDKISAVFEDVAENMEEEQAEREAEEWREEALTLRPGEFCNYRAFASMDPIMVELEKNKDKLLPSTFEWIPQHRILVVMPNIIFERSNGSYRSWLRGYLGYNATASAGDTEGGEKERETEENEEEEPYTTPIPTVTHNIAPDPPASNSYPLVASEAVTLALTDELVWQGNASTAWDTSSRNWSLDGSTTTFSEDEGALVSVVFDSSGNNRDINVTSDRSVQDMTITANDYSFSGGGSLTIAGTLDIRVAEIPGTSYDFPATTTFAQGTDIKAGAILLRSGINTLTTFNGNVTAGAITLSNCYSHGENAGKYVFNGDVTVNGDFNAELGTKATGADINSLLEVYGDLSAANITLGGAGIKEFIGTVTMTGNLTVNGTEGTTRDGEAMFLDTVIIGGKKLVIGGNATATFDNKLLTEAGGRDAADLEITLNNGKLLFSAYTTNLSGTYSLGSITLIGDHNELDLSPLTLADANVTGSDEGGSDFTVGGSAKRLDLQLTNIKNLNLNGGNINIESGSAGQILGDLNLSEGTSATLQGNNVFSSTASGNISIAHSVLNIGSTTQTLYGDIALKDSATLMGSGGSVALTENASVTYTGTGNKMDATLAAGAHQLTVQADPTDDATHQKDTTLSITGDITGTGTLLFTGMGETRIESDLTYTGTVQVAGSTMLVLDSANALLNAGGITVGNGAGLSVTHGGSATVLNGAYTLTDENGNVYTDASGNTVQVGLLLEDGARLNFTNLSGHGDTPAIVLNNGKLLFGGNVTISFNETGEGKLENLHTYTLVASAAGIDQMPGTTAGSVTVYANGQDSPLDSSQYEFSYMNADGVRYFSITMLVGKSWCGGAEGYWHAMTDGTYTNWTEGAVGDTALFRTQAGIADVSITMDAPSGAESLYMDGTTNYTITGTDATADGAFKGEAPLLIKKGSGSMTFSKLPATLSDITVSEGTLAFANGSHITTTGDINIALAAYDSQGTLKEDAALSIDSSSTLQQGAGTLSGYGDNAAVLHGVSISGGNITGLQSTISSATSTPTISNASFGIDASLEGDTKESSNGYTLSNVTLTGTGSIDHTTLGAGVGISGNYSLGDAVTVTATVTNTGTISVNSSTVLGIGRMESTDNTYTIFSGGNYTNWDTLGTSNFRLHGSLLSEFKDISVDTETTAGSVTITTNGVSILNWDSDWGIDSWDAPAVALTGTPLRDNDKNNGNYFVVNSGKEGAPDFCYAARLTAETESANHIYVADIPATASASDTLIGIKMVDFAATSEENPLDIWINDNGSGYARYVGGAGIFKYEEGNYTEKHYYGDSHLQISSALQKKVTVAAGSQQVVQHGDTYLSIADGTYDLAIGGAFEFNSGNAALSTHYGNALVHLTGGTYTNVIGGSYKSYTLGNTRVIVDSGTITNLYGGDYMDSSSTHTGSTVVDLRGGTVTNVYGAGNNSNVTGTVSVNLYADDEGTMLTTFGSNAKLHGGANVTTGDSILSFQNAGTYDLTGVTINQFDRFELVEGAEVSVVAGKFNLNNALTISGPGDVTVTSGSTKTARSVYLVNGATLNIRTSYYYDNAKQDPANYSRIYVADGTTLDITGCPVNTANGASLAVRLNLAGDGTNGLGALYKGNDTVNPTLDGGSSKAALGYITLTDNASIGGGNEVNADIYITPYTFDDGTTVEKYAATIDLLNEAELSADNRGYILTKQGGNTIHLSNVDVLGGTLNLVEGAICTYYNSAAGNTDLVLHAGATLQIADDAKGNQPGTGELNSANTTAVPAEHNGIGFESISGNGTIQLGKENYLYIDMNQNYGDFTSEFGTSAQAGQLFYNSEGYTYAHFSGLITDTSESFNTVTKAGSGTQWFEGSESDYHGTTTIEGGILYLTGTSTATSFSKGSTVVAKGVVGVSTLSWQGGAVYLGDGVRIYNNGDCDAIVTVLGTEVTPTMTIGVDAVAQEDGALYYNEATYSGVLTSDGGMEKAGLGTLNVDQQGSFAGGTTITGGTLNLYGWASANDAVLTQTPGTTLMFSYDASYEGEGGTTTFSEATRFELVGTGDARWVTDASRAGNDGRTAALISDIGELKTLVIAGTISDGTVETTTTNEEGETSTAQVATSGNLLHSGEGTLILSGANSYTGGTTVTAGTLVVGNNTGLGATARGGSANLVTTADSGLVVDNGVATTLAATAENGFDGNDIRGNVQVGIELEEGTTAAAASLTMTGNGYYANRTELESNATLTFDGTAASNWDGVANTAGKETMAGANVLAGNGTVVVTNRSSHFATDNDSVDDTYVQGSRVYFELTDSLHTEENGFAGDIEVRGDNTTLHIQGGEINGGDYTISGNGARLDAKRSSITVNEDMKVSLISTGDAYREEGSTAVLAAQSVTVNEGGHLLAQQAVAFASEDTEQTQIDVAYALGSYRTDSYHYNYSTGEVITTYDKYFASNKMDNLNRQTVAQLDTEGGLTMEAGSIYELYDTNVSLSGTQLTFNVTEDAKIVLRGTGALQDYLEELIYADQYEEANPGETYTTNQWVLFSDVGSFNAILDGSNLTEGAVALQYREMRNEIYVMLASDFLTTDIAQANAAVMLADDVDGTTSTTTAALDPLASSNILLVYDAGARVVYLDRNPNNYEPLEEDDYHPIELPEAVPEPTTATLSLLALCALATRRRRK